MDWYDMVTMYPVTQMKKTVEQTFWEHVLFPTVESSCWLWTGIIVNGYGQIRRGRKKVKRYYAHRVSWEIHNNRYAGIFDVMHSCDNPLCVNPDHLSLGTRLENIVDAKNKGRMKGGILSHVNVENIRKMYSTNKKTQSQIAEIYSVSPSMVSRVVNGERWVNNG